MDLEAFYTAAALTLGHPLIDNTRKGTMVGSKALPKPDTLTYREEQSMYAR